MDTTDTVTSGLEPQVPSKMPKCYLDIVFSQGSVGPKQLQGSKHERLTQAITTIKVNNDLTVRIGDSSSDIKEDKQKDDVVELKVFEGEPSDGMLKLVVAAFKAFDKITHSAIGTEPYIKKQSEFETARRNVLSGMGLNPDSQRIEFTEAQRAIYNQSMKQCSFDYYRIQLTWKQPGQKKVRSKSYSGLKPFDKAKFVSNLKKEAKDIESNVKITRIQ